MNQSRSARLSKVVISSKSLKLRAFFCINLNCYIYLRSCTSFTLNSSWHGDLNFIAKIIIPDDFETDRKHAILRLVIEDTHKVVHEVWSGTRDQYDHEISNQGGYGKAFR